MLEGKLRSIEYQGEVYDVRLSFAIDEFHANRGGFTVSDPRILAELFSVNRAILFGESLLDFRKGALLNNISSAENAAAYIDIVNDLERAYDTLITSASLISTAYVGWKVKKPSPEVWAGLAQDMAFFVADMTLSERETGTFELLFDPLVSAARDISLEAYQTYLTIRDGSSPVNAQHAVSMAKSAAYAVGMSRDLNSLISEFDFSTESPFTVAVDLFKAVGSSLFGGYVTGLTANSAGALSPRWKEAVELADGISTLLSLVDFSATEEEFSLYIEDILNAASDRYELASETLDFLDPITISQFEAGFVGLQDTPADPLDDYIEPDLSDDHSDRSDAATVVTAGSISGFTSLDGIIESRIDRDVFEAQLQGGQEYSFLLWANTTQNSRLDPELTIRSPSGTVWRNDNLTNNTTMSFLSFVAPQSGTYVLESRGVGDSTGSYWLNITPIDIDPTADDLEPSNETLPDFEWNGENGDWHGTDDRDGFPTPGWDGNKGDINAGNRLRGHDGDDDIEGRGGDDIIWGDNDEDDIKGGDGDDTIRGGRHDDTIDGDDGDDLIYGEHGDDFIDGDTSSSRGFGHDTIYAGDGEDDVDGGPGDDYIKGEDDNDTLDGNDGDDEIYGDRGDDDLDGDDGDDLLFGGPGRDTLDGGHDRDRLAGEDGDDSLEGDDGDDALYGGEDDDTLQGGKGDDLLHGEDGTDTADFSDGRDGVIVNLFDEIAVSNDLGTDRLYGIENVFGSRGDDVIDGDHARNVLHGDDGDDIIRGHDANDTIFGNDDDDVVWGDKGDDYVYGGEDDDEVRGGLGKDHLFGDAGDDHLRGEQGDDVIDGGIGTDTVFFWGEHNDFSISAGGIGEVIVTDLRADGLEGRDVLSNVEYIEFFDGKALVSDLLATAPSAVKDAVEVDGYRPARLALLDNDITNASDVHFTSAEVSAGLGAVSIIGGQLIYDPGNNFSGLLEGETASVEIKYSFTTSGFQTAIGTADVTVIGIAELGAFSDATSWSAGKDTWLFWADQEWMTGDFNGDGADDVMASYDIDDKVVHRVYLSDGEGSFGDAKSWSAGKDTWLFWADQEWMTGDFNGDGADDVMASYDIDDKVVHRVYLSDGEGSFGDATSWSAGKDTWLFWADQEWMTGDFNGDGADDVMASYDIDDKVVHRVYLSDGEGSFGDATSWSAGKDTWLFWADQEWMTGDFNGDGADDVMASYDIDDKVVHRVYLSDGEGSFGDATSWSAGKDTWLFWADQEWMTGDFNGDGADDVMASYDIDDKVVHRVYLSDGEGSFGDATSWSAGKDTWLFWADQEWMTGDFNGDGADGVMASYDIDDKVVHRVYEAEAIVPDDFLF